MTSTVLTYQQQKKQQKTFGDLSPEQKQKFILKHLSNRKNFVASVPFDKSPKKQLKNDKNIPGDVENRRIMIQNVVDEEDIVKSRKLVKKLMKKVVNSDT